ncbi:MAG: pyruvate kinase [Desulfonauticus sp.]|jgi:pyruvate kinase|nr:MAG: Pyruvate kinase [Desulfonauticus sp. 38_4375]MDK2922193.1 pyruvate kinase [Desulfonauticus sp.]
MRTRIIATLGPASEKVEVIKGLIENGVSIFRLNFSHGRAKDFENIVQKIRTIEEELKKPLTLLQDLCGPKIRIGHLKKSPLTVHKEELFYLGKGPQEAENFIPFANLELLDTLSPKDLVRISDGGLAFEVLKNSSEELLLKARDNGLITSGKGITFPGKRLKLAALTEKDKQDILEGIDLGIDALALSFVQGPEDIAQAKAICAKKNKKLPVIAKLERQAALDRLEDILAIADGIMVARGDLGLECPLPSLPFLQKEIIRKCKQTGKPVIVATQMLLSMVNSPMPTRAETTDIANAILDGADCVMLSEETAIGNYPVEAVKYMREIGEEAEKNFFKLRKSIAEPQEKDSEMSIAHAACVLAQKLKAKALLAHTNSGTTARLLSSFRPEEPIYGLSPSASVLKYMNFFWGVIPILTGQNIIDHLRRVEYFVENSNKFVSKDLVVITAGHPKEGQDSCPTNLIKVYIK